MRIRGRAVLIVSHPSSVAINQEVYAELARRGWNIHLIVPKRWKHDYAPATFRPVFLPELDNRGRRLPVAFAGEPLRHFYLARVSQVLRKVQPAVAFLEQEPFALVTGQWMWALTRMRVPFGLQHDENLDRSFPPPLSQIRTSAIRRASFVAARSPRAAALLKRERPSLRAPVVPHPMPEWAVPERRPHARFTIGFAGRLVPEKGVEILLQATEALDDVHLLFVGDGPLRERVERATTPARTTEVRRVDHDSMATAYTDMDVLVLPSLTTKTWAEQFGRVLIEAQWCGTPVVGSDSGEIPWVVGETGGGVIVEEGDVTHLREAIQRLRSNPQLRHELAATGRTTIEQRFTTSAVAGQMEDLFEYAALEGVAEHARRP